MKRKGKKRRNFAKCVKRLLKKKSNKSRNAIFKISRFIKVNNI